MASLREQLARGIMAGIMNGPKMTLLPRSQAFAAWKKITDTSPENLQRLAQEVFPCTLGELAWAAVVSPAIDQELFALFIAAPLPVNDGTCLRFVAVWKWLMAVRPEIASKGTVAVIDVGGPEKEVTLLHQGFPLFCGNAEIDKVLSHVRQAHRQSIPDVSETIYVPAGGAESAIDLAGIEAIPWLLAPELHVSPVRKFWDRHKTNTLSAAAALFVMLGMALQNKIDDGHVRLRQLTRELNPQQESARRSSKAVPGQALGALVEAARRTPAAAHLLSFRYDAAAGSVMVDGRAADYGIVSDYVAELSKRKIFRDVRSEKTRLEQMDGRSVVVFSIKALLR